MTSRRILKAASAIREVVSLSILTELRDPRIQHVTVTQVELASDMQQAKVYISVMGDEKAQQLALHGLQSASGFLQAKISKRIDTRYTPRLKFMIDKGVKNSIAIAEILRQVLPSGKETSPDPDGEETPEIASDSAVSSESSEPAATGSEAPPDLSSSTSAAGEPPADKDPPA